VCRQEGGREERRRGGRRGGRERLEITEKHGPLMYEIRCLKLQGLEMVK